MNFTPLQDFLDQITKWRIVGADLLIYIKNKPVFRYSSGYSDLENKIPVNQQALYNLYSATKIITCTAALKLFEQGRFSMSDPLSKYIPEFKEMYLKNGKKVQNPITIEHLFTMTAGFGFNIHCPSIMSVRKDTGGKCPTMDIVKALSKEPLLFEPGTTWAYGLCHDVLGGVIEVISGKKFEDYLKENIFIPLGMNNTTFHLTDNNREKMCKQYLYDEQTGKHKEISLINTFKFGTEYESGGAGIISSVDDYILLASALANQGVAPNGVKILSPDTIELMRTNMLNEKQLIDFNWPHLKGYGYGYGVRTMLSPETAHSLSHVGEFGWGGAAGAHVLIDPENSMAVYYAQHMLCDQQEYVHPRLRNKIYECLARN